MEYRTADIRTGLFILFSLVAFTGLIFLMGGVRGAFRDAAEVRVLFDDVRLLEVEAPVTIGGFRVGEVASIRRVEVPGPYRVEVRLAVDRTVDLRQDASAMVRTDGFLGRKFVALNPGVATGRLAPDRAISGRAETDIAGILALLEEPIGRLNRILTEVESFSTKPGNLDRLEGILAESHELLRAVRRDFLPRAERLVARVSDTLEDVGGKVSTLSARVNTTLGQGSRTLTDLATAVQERIGRLDAILTEMHGAVTDTRRGLNKVLGGADRVLLDNNRNLYLTVRNLRDTTAELERLARKLRADPSVLVWGDDEKVEPRTLPADPGERRRAGRARRYGKEAR